MALILVVSADERDVAALTERRDGSTFRRVAPGGDLDAAMRTDPVDLAVIGPSVDDPITALQRLHGVDRSLPVLVLCTAASYDPVRESMRVAPLIGTFVRILPLDRDPMAVEHVLDEMLEMAQARDRHARVTSSLEPVFETGTRARPYLGVLLEQLPVGVLTLDPDHRVVGFNRAARRLLPADALHRERAVTACFSDPEAVAELLRSASSADVDGVAGRFEIESPGRPSFVDAVAAEAGTKTGERALLLLLEDVTAQVVAEQERDRAEVELRFQKRLLETESEASIDGILVVSPDGRILYSNRRFAEMWSIPDEIIAGGSDEEAMQHVLGMVEDPEGFEARIRHLYDRPMEQSRDEIALRGGRVFDRFSTPLHDPEAGFLGRAWYFRDVTADRELESALRASREQFALLADASAVFASFLDDDAILRRLADLAVAGPADWCVVDLLGEDGAVTRLTVAHALPEMREAATGLLKYPPRRPHPAIDVMEQGRSILMAKVDPSVVAATAHDEEHARLMQQHRIHSAMVVPLTARGRVVGAISMVSADPDRTYDEDDLRLAEDLALRAGLAVENARLFTERSRQARTLQRALLPPDLPAIPGVDLAAAYLPAGEQTEVGGDFYDAFHLGGPSWAIALGDVCGKGVEAAVLTGLCRHTIRAAAYEGSEPSTVVGVLNRAVYREAGSASFATACYGVLTSGADGVHLELASAGHPPPLVLRADGRVESAGHPGGLLGCFEEYEPVVHRMDLSEGDLLLLYTDGVTEARRGKELFGEGRLTEVLRGCRDLEAGEVTTRVADAVSVFQNGGQRDDIALVAVRISAR